jgi:hypothetical protein
MYALHHTSRRNEAHIVNLSNGKKTEKKRKKKKVCGQMPVWPFSSSVENQPQNRQNRVEPK